MDSYPQRVAILGRYDRRTNNMTVVNQYHNGGQIKAHRHLEEEMLFLG